MINVLADEFRNVQGTAATRASAEVQERRGAEPDGAASHETRIVAEARGSPESSLANIDPSQRCREDHLLRVLAIFPVSWRSL